MSEPMYRKTGKFKYRGYPSVGGVVHPPPGNPVLTIWHLLTRRNVWMRAAGILLLKEYAANLTANGKGATASRLVETFRKDYADYWKQPYKPGKPIRA